MSKVSVVTVKCAHPHAKSSPQDSAMAKQSESEERSTMKDYTERGAKAKSPGLKKAFAHAKSEERKHASSFAEEAKESAAHERGESRTQERREHRKMK